MKKFIVCCFAGLMITGSVWCMQNSVKIETNDNNEYIINREIADFFQTIKKLIEDIGVEEAIPLPLVSSKEWDAIFKIFIDSKTQKIRSIDAVNEALRYLNLGHLLSLLNAIDYLDPQVKDKNHELIDVADAIFTIIKEKIKANPSAAIRLLQENKYTIPAQFESLIALELLIAKKITYELNLIPIRHITPAINHIHSVAWSSDGRLAIAYHNVVGIRDENLKSKWLPEVRIKKGWTVRSVAWHSDGRLAIAGAEDLNMYIREANGDVIKFNSRGLNPVNSVAWHPDGRLAMGGDGVRIRETNGAIIPVDMQRMGGVVSVAWHPDGRLAIASGFHVRIREVNGAILPVDIQGLKGVNSVAWHPDGRLAIGGEQGVHIREANGTIILAAQKSVRSVAWHPDGRLAMDDYLGVRIRKTNGTIIPVNAQGLGEVRSVAWSQDSQLAIGGNGVLGIYYGEIIPEYEQLTIPQALLIIKLATDPEATVTHDEVELYETLDQKIKDKYPLEICPARK